jgi:hypothetical protein
MQFTNRLAKETSPYLLQHAHNPVDWYSWGNEALEAARKEDKPILVSIGYSSCHWCHVMERESFEDVSTAEIMNRHFINIKIDREERPDLDHIYMDAVQAITGSGGWPLNVFLTPELKPFYGGTYFPPVRAYNRASWKEVLYGVAQAYTERRTEIEEQANQLTAHLQNANEFGTDNILQLNIPEQELFKQQHITEIFEAIMKTADTEWGGFGRAPKFPQTFIITWLFRYHYYTGNKEALQQACLSLNKMIMGGMYDHVGGGFARYSTDTEWRVPHFEKMLYDNALFVLVLSEAYQLTKNVLYEKTIHETLAFVEQEMTTPEFGFCSALDADSEGVEGKYYTWQKKEIDKLLEGDAALFCSLYNITEAGNWEDVNIPHLTISFGEFASQHQLAMDVLETKIKKSMDTLAAARRRRVKPLLDDKIILGWNALMNTAYAKAFAATGVKKYRQTAEKNMNFLLNAFQLEEGGEMHHVWKSGEAKFPAFLDDYAYLIQALIHLQEINSQTNLLEKAKQLTRHVSAAFRDESSAFFFYTPTHQRDIVVRKKEVYDGAVPSGNAVMASNLWYLGLVFDNMQWQQESVQLVGSLLQAITRYPGSFGVWACHLLGLQKGYLEIAIVGEGSRIGCDEVLKWFLPYRVIQAAQSANKNFPLLDGKIPEKGTSLYYLCSNYKCLKPAGNTREFQAILNETTLKQ